MCSRRAPAPRNREVLRVQPSCAASRPHQGRLPAAGGGARGGPRPDACSPRGPRAAPGPDAAASRVPAAAGGPACPQQQRPGRRPALPGRPRGHGRGLGEQADGQGAAAPRGRRGRPARGGGRPAGGGRPVVGRTGWSTARGKQASGHGHGERHRQQPGRPALVVAARGPAQPEHADLTAAWRRSPARTCGTRAWTTAS